MDNKKFLQYLAKKGKKQTYLDACKDLIDEFYSVLNGKPPTSKAIDKFVRKKWSGYVNKDRAVYQILNEYADFCEIEAPVFNKAYQKHIRETFEGEARKAMNSYKKTIVNIPKGTKIASSFLEGLTNDEFVAAFKALQEFIYNIYDDIERGSPFEWGWLDWKALTVDGLNHNRVIRTLEAMAGGSNIEGDTMVVDKNIFGEYDICRPITNAKLMLKGFMNNGFYIEELDNKKSPVFIVSYPDNPKLISVLYSYFKNRRSDCHQCGDKCTGDDCSQFFDYRHVRFFSYRFVEAPSIQTREPFFLAKTDGEPEQLRRIYYWLYDEAVKNGFSPQGCDYMGCYSYKKGSKEWLLLGSGSSYHEDEFLHSPNYALAAKVRFLRVFQTHPEKIDNLMKRFPDSFGRPWTQCYKCNSKSNECNKRVSFKKGSQVNNYCGKHHHLYFHDPNFDDVKAILDLYKIENNIE